MHRRGADLKFFRNDLPAAEERGARLAVTTDQSSGSTKERRRYGRVNVVWGVTVEPIQRVRWQGEIVSFGPFGMKVRIEKGEPVPVEGTVVRFQLTPRDGESSLSIEGIVCRVDPDGLAITFINLRSATFERLKQLVDTLPGNAV